MAIKNRVHRVEDTFDGDYTWSPDHLLGGVLQVNTNSSPTTVKTFPYQGLLVGDGAEPGESFSCIIWNRGSEPLTVQTDPSATDSLIGDPVIAAGQARQFQFVLSYSSGLGISLAVFSL